MHGVANLGKNAVPPSVPWGLDIGRTLPTRFVLKECSVVSLNETSLWD